TPPDQNDGTQGSSELASKNPPKYTGKLEIKDRGVGIVCSNQTIGGLDYTVKGSKNFHTLLLPAKEAKEYADKANMTPEPFELPIGSVQEQALSFDDGTTDEISGSNPSMVLMEPKERCLVILNRDDEKRPATVDVEIQWFTVPTKTSHYTFLSSYPAELVERRNEPKVKPWLPWLTDGSKNFHDYDFNMEPKGVLVKEKNPAPITFDGPDKKNPEPVSEKVTIPPSNATFICSKEPVGGISYTVKGDPGQVISTTLVMSEKQSKLAMDYFRGINVDVEEPPLPPKMQALTCISMGFPECSNSNPPGQLMDPEIMCLGLYNDFENATTSVDVTIQWLTVKTNTTLYDMSGPGSPNILKAAENDISYRPWYTYRASDAPKADWMA
ncbi:hypothetical protein BJ684DRAFT_21141, partial [Piptocephalis cylindrospora]